MAGSCHIALLIENVRAFRFAAGQGFGCLNLGGVAAGVVGVALALALTAGQNIDIRVASIIMGVHRTSALGNGAVQRPIIDIAVVGVGVAVAGIGAGQLLDLHVLVTTVSMGVGGLSADQPGLNRRCGQSGGKRHHEGNRQGKSTFQGTSINFFHTYLPFFANLLGCKVSGGRAGIVVDTLAPIALRPVISGGLLIIISGWAGMTRGARFSSLALRPAVSGGLPFIISGQADISPQRSELGQRPRRGGGFTP